MAKARHANVGPLNFYIAHILSVLFLLEREKDKAIGEALWHVRYAVFLIQPTISPPNRHHKPTPRNWFARRRRRVAHP